MVEIGIFGYDHEPLVRGEFPDLAVVGGAEAALVDVPGAGIQGAESVAEPRRFSSKSSFMR